MGGLAETGAAHEAGDGGGAAALDDLPDHLVLRILDLVGDARCLARCRATCRRLDALVACVDRLIIRVDAVVPISRSSPCPLLLLPRLGHLLRSVVRALSGLLAPPPLPSMSPSDLIRAFPRARCLEIELPGGDIRREKGAAVRWKAEFGGTLRRCAILAARRVGWGRDGRGEDGAAEGADGIKERVIWTIGVLVSVSARHHMAREVVRGRRKGPVSSGDGDHEAADMLEQVLVTDKDGEGTLVMGRGGVRACMEDGGGWDGEKAREAGIGRRRTTLPAVKMKMRCAERLEVDGGGWMEGATLVVVRPAEDGEEAEVQRWAAEAFDRPFRGAAVELLKRPGYSLEMNSF